MESAFSECKEILEDRRLEARKNQFNANQDDEVEEAKTKGFRQGLALALSVAKQKYKEGSN